MKTIIIISLFFLSILCFNTSAQEVTFSGKHGNAFNFGLGSGGIIAYNGLGISLTMFHVNYKYNTAKKITFNSTGGFYRDRLKYNWENNKQDYAYTNYYFQKTTIPTDAKSIYNFNKKLTANSKKDFYLTDSSDNTALNSSWDDDYLGVELSFHLSGTSPIGFDIY
jgi:hypothetical protein